MDRGSIHLVNFDPAKGGEIGKLRPAIVMSDGEANELLDTCIVIPLSTVIEPDALPYRYKITKRAKLKHDSDACINEIRALSKTRLGERIADLSDNELAVIVRALCEVLGQNHPSI